MKILFIPLEFLRWKEARAMAYTAQLALEEGFRHHNVELTTLPNLSSGSELPVLRPCFR